VAHVLLTWLNHRLGQPRVLFQRVRPARLGIQLQDISCTMNDTDSSWEVGEIFGRPELAPPSPGGGDGILRRICRRTLAHQEGIHTRKCIKFPSVHPPQRMPGRFSTTRASAPTPKPSLDLPPGAANSPPSVVKVDWMAPCTTVERKVARAEFKCAKFFV
jgi:hypothetical protein